MGLDILDRINEVQPGPQDFPLDEILIIDCGDANHQGVSKKQEASQMSTTPEEAAKQHREISRRTQEELKYGYSSFIENTDHG